MFLRRVSFYYTVIILAMFFIVFIGLVLVIAHKVFSYSVGKTHPGIVSLASQLYNNKFPDKKLTRQEVSWLQYGSVTEDTPNRWFNHFYDPVYNQGFKGQYLTAKEWANNSHTQAKFALGDKTWARAISDYQQGNKEEAIKSLGHILHLIADVSVPAHTRNDAHILGDSYEQFVETNWRTISENLKSKVILVDSLNTIFDQIANYTNKNFYSDDTIISYKYSYPKLDELYFDGSYFIGSLNNKNYKLAQARKSILLPNFYIYKLDREVLTDYSNYVLPQVVGYSAGAIDLFFREINQDSKNYDLPAERISWRGYLDQMLGTVVSEVHNLYYKIKGASGQVAGNSKHPEPKSSPVNSSVVNITQPEEKNFDLESNKNTSTLDSQAVELPIINSQDIKKSNNQDFNLSDYQNTVSSSNSLIEANSLLDTTTNKLLEPEPADIISSSSLLYSSPIQISSFVFSSGEVSQPNLNKRTNKKLEEFPVNTTSVTHDQTVTSSVVFVTTTISSSSIFVISSTIASTTDIEQTTSSSSPSSTPITVASSTIISSSTEEFVSSSSSPAHETIIENDNVSTTIKNKLSRQIVINEIAWAGTHADYPNDEWIELYNNSSSSVDISDWQIFLDGKKLNITKHNNKVIKPFSYYLLERSDDNTIKQIEADAIFSGGIKNSGAKIELFNSAGKKIDQVNANKGWFAGGGNKYRSMERINSLESGGDKNNWQSNQGIRITGRSYNGLPIYGSPKRANRGFIALNYRQEDDLVILTKANNPYVLQYYEIPSGKTLRLEPGVVVKSYYPNSYIDIQGKLEILGTSTDKVIFTSGRDSSFNNKILNTMVGDWDSPIPQPKDWQGFWFKASSTGWIDNLDMRYAGNYFALANYLPPLTSQSIRAESSIINIKNSKFSHQANTILYSKNSSTTVNNSNFFNSKIAIRSVKSDLKLAGLEFNNIVNEQGPLYVDGGWPLFTDLKFTSGTVQRINLGDIKIKNQTVSLDSEINYLISHLTVDSSSTLYIDPGTKINLSSYGTININGSLKAVGTNNNPIVIGANNGWGYLKFNNSSSTLSNVYFTGGGGIPSEQDAALTLQDSNLFLLNTKIWNSRAPGNCIKSTNSVLKIKNSRLGRDNKWPDPVWPGMSYTTGIKMVGGKLFMDNIDFVNLNYGVFKIKYNDKYPLISADNMLESNYFAVYKQYAW